jgi:hypothetical protein
MRAVRTPAVVLAILTLMLGVVQCLAACVTDDCNSALPPCHQQQHQNQHQTANACAQDFQVGERTHVAASAMIGMVHVTPHAVPELISIELLTSPALSPPNLSASTKSVLRI